MLENGNELNPEAGSKRGRANKIKIENENMNQNIEPKRAEQKATLANELLQLQHRNQQIRQNITMIKTPLQKVERIALLSLDEQVCQSLCDEVKQVVRKFTYVLVPRQDQGSKCLRNWDLWGPFFMAILFIFFIDKKNSTIVWLFFSLVIGAAVVQFNVVVIGGKLSYFQAFSILSYCIFPIFLTTLVIVILNFFNVKNKVVNKILMAIATVWAVACTYAIYEAIKVFLGANVAQNKILVAVYPAALYYLYIAFYLSFF